MTEPAKRAREEEEEEKQPKKQKVESLDATESTAAPAQDGMVKVLRAFNELDGLPCDFRILYAGKWAIDCHKVHLFARPAEEQAMMRSIMEADATNLELSEQVGGVVAFASEADMVAFFELVLTPSTKIDDPLEEVHTAHLLDWFGFKTLLERCLRSMEYRSWSWPIDTAFEVGVRYRRPQLLDCVAARLITAGNPIEWTDFVAKHPKAPQHLAPFLVDNARTNYTLRQSAQSKLTNIRVAIEEAEDTYDPTEEVECDDEYHPRNCTQKEEYHPVDHFASHEYDDGVVYATMHTIRGIVRK